MKHYGLIAPSLLDVYIHKEKKKKRRVDDETIIPRGLMKLWKELDRQHGKLHHILQSRYAGTGSPVNQP